VELGPDDPLDEALSVMADADVTRAAVVEHGSVVGSLTYRDALTTYRMMLTRGLRRAETLPPTAMMLELHTAPGAPVVGRSLREVQLPPQVLVIAITRGGEALFPTAESVFAAGDQVTVMASPESQPALQDLFGETTTSDINM
jgi:NhaP-type Na+/H+ and K+/H+ antiporter